jgi:hypothetical protein
MVPAVLLLAFVAPAHHPSPNIGSWIPARWRSHDPQSLETVQQTPVNCLLLEQRDWDGPFVASAGQRGIATLGVIHPGQQPPQQAPDQAPQQAIEAARQAATLNMTGVVLEGDFPESVVAAIEGLNILAIRLPSRSALAFHPPAPLLGTYQGVWPGVEIQKDGVAVSAPSGSPWIDTNAGFLRFVRVAASGRPVWIANTPPPGMVIAPRRYLQAIADAESAGAHWVIALDDDLAHRLLAREATALDAWRRMGELLNFYAGHPEWRALRPCSTLALLEDVDSGALLAGGIIDMLAAKHTTVLPVPLRSFGKDSLAGTTMAVNVDPAALTAAQREALRAWTRAGNTLLTAPPGWKMPMPDDPRQIALNRDQIAKLGEIWRELNSLINSRNPGGKIFNAPSTISNLLAGPAGRPVVLHLVNYSDYPVEDVTVRQPGHFSRVKVLAPGEAPRPLELFEQDGVTEIVIPRLGVAAAVVLE